ncbi:MAG TPA: aspartate kinase [Gammaproteobacteria bacterium]|nr:aspartate kinase [Gammaproteobacteria bacterium]
MALIVQKFGGTSVGSLDRIAHVANKIIQAKNQGHQLVVVSSAMNGETDRLIQLANAFSDQPEAREYDAMVATGEQVATALISIALNSKQCQARSYSGAQVRITTNSVHKKARIVNINPEVLRADINAGIIPVVAGFQGIDSKGDITTLGRGGSDTTAVALAAALKADECQIYTDVDGVYTTDPRMVPSARRLNRITFEEMLELASLGAKVLQIRAVEFAGKFNVPVRVLSTFTDGPGTLITFEDNSMEQPLVSGIAFDRNQAKLTLLGLPDRPGVASYILAVVSQHNIDVDMIVQNVPRENKSVDFSFTVQRDDYKNVHALMEQLAKDLGAQGLLGDARIAKLSLVGVGMRSHAGVATTMFKTLAEEGINIQLISTSEIKISVVIDEKYLELGARSLHAAFGLDVEPMEEERL